MTQPTTQSTNPPADAPDAHAWVEFTSFKYEGTDPASARVGKDEFLNPILAGFYPDPSICRVGDEYFIVNSSFAWFPGVPIFKSEDLVNWTQIGHVLDRPSQLNLDGAGVSRGIFAPTISHHGDTFYMITTIIDRGGNFFVTAKNPDGPWSDPIWLKEVNGIDPSFYFDDETGQAYIVHNGPPPDDKPQYSGHRAIWLHEFDEQTGKVLPGGKIIVNGGTSLDAKPVWIEAPHIIHRNNWYYLYAAEGGTGPEHSEVVFRSKSVWGPWDVFEGNPILTQRQLAPSRGEPVTCVGHAELVETQNGEWWAVFLGCRPYEEKYTNIGRETFMLPVTWENDWPTILRGDAVVPRNMKRPNLPPQPVAPVPLTGSFSWTDEFDSPELSLAWNMLRTPREKWYSLTAKKRSLLLAPRPVELSSTGNPSFLARRQQHAEFSATTTLLLSAQTTRSDAGLVVFQNETHYFFLGVHNGENGPKTVFVERCAGEPASAKPETIAKADVAPGTSTIELKVNAALRNYSFSYRMDGTGEWKPLIADADGTILSTQVAGGFVGSCVGLFARSVKAAE